MHKRISGVEPKLHTQKFINDELEKVYESFLDSEASTTGSVPNFDLNIYEVIYYLSSVFYLPFIIEYLETNFHSNKIFRQSSFSFHDVLRQVLLIFIHIHQTLFVFLSYSLFLGICKDTVDDLLNNNKTTKTGILMRFAVFKEQETPDNPNIIFAIYNSLYYNLG